MEQQIIFIILIYLKVVISVWCNIWISKKIYKLYS